MSTVDYTKNRSMFLVIFGIISSHLWCSLFYLQEPSAAIFKKMYAISAYSCVSIMSFAFYIISASFALTVFTGLACSLANSFMILEFMDGPEVWSNEDGLLFLSNIILNLLALSVLNKIKQGYQ